MRRAARRQILGSRLKRFRTARALTQRQLGSLSRLSSQYISDVECGRRGIRFANLCRIAGALGLSVSSFLDLELEAHPSRRGQSPAAPSAPHALPVRPWLRAVDTAEHKAALGARIARLRKQQGLSQAKLCLMAGIGHAYLVDVEKGRRNVGFDNLCRIAAALGVTVSELTDIGDPSRAAPAPKG